MNEGGNILEKLWWPPQRVSKLAFRALSLRHETLFVNKSCIEILEITVKASASCVVLL